MTYEVSPRREVASANELLELHTVATHWLAVHGKLFIEPEDANNVSEYDGLRISDNYPCLEAAVPGDKIRAVLPEAVEILQVGDQLSLEYNFPHYQPLQPGLAFVSPFSIFRTSSYENVTPQSRTFQVKYDPTLRACKGLVDPMGDRLEESIYMEGEPITRQECDALSEIVSKLDVILNHPDSPS